MKQMSPVLCRKKKGRAGGCFGNKKSGCPASWLPRAPLLSGVSAGAPQGASVAAGSIATGAEEQQPAGIWRGGTCWLHRRRRLQLDPGWRHGLASRRPGAGHLPPRDDIAIRVVQQSAIESVAAAQPLVLLAAVEPDDHVHRRHLAAEDRGRAEGAVIVDLAVQHPVVVCDLERAIRARFACQWNRGSRVRVSVAGMLSVQRRANGQVGWNAMKHGANMGRAGPCHTAGPRRPPELLSARCVVRAGEGAQHQCRPCALRAVAWGADCGRAFACTW